MSLCKRKNNIFFEEAINVCSCLTTFYNLGGSSKDRRRAIRILKQNHRKVEIDVTNYVVCHD